MLGWAGHSKNEKYRCHKILNENLKGRCHLGRQRRKREDKETEYKPARILMTNFQQGKRKVDWRLEQKLTFSCGRPRFQVEGS
jgi:hypothetical protein